MLEFISLLGPSTSDVLASMQTRKAKTEEELRIERISMKTKRRPGFGSQAPSSQSSTRQRKAPTWDCSSVAFLVAGMRDTHFQAAMVFVSSDDFVAQERLAQLLMSKGGLLQSASTWKGMSAPKRIEMAQALARLVVWEFATPRAQHTQQNRFTRLGISKSAWNSTWKTRYGECYVKLHLWLSEAESYMKRRSHGGVH